MKSLGIQNFRRFQQTVTINYGGITFLVGGNNTGKSTIVKALLLIDEYLKSLNVSVFSFSNKSLESANIITYGRAKNKLTQQTV